MPATYNFVANTSHSGFSSTPPALTFTWSATTDRKIIIALLLGSASDRIVSTVTLSGTSVTGGSMISQSGSTWPNVKLYEIPYSSLSGFGAGSYTLQVTCDAAGYGIKCAAWELEGATGSAQAAVYAEGDAATQTATITPSWDGAVIIGAGGATGDASATLTSGYTIIGSANDVGGGRIQFGYKTGATPATSSTAVGNSAGASAVIGYITAYQAASAGPTYTLTASGGSYTQTGTAANLLFNRTVSAASGSYSLTGTAANLVHGYTLAAASGSYSQTGTAANLYFNRAITAASGSYTYTGTSASLLFNRLLTASSGAYTLTGTDATLTYTPAGAYVLTASPGSYAQTGTDAALKFNRVITASSGSYSLTGTAAALSYGRFITASAGSYALTGTSANFIYSRVLVASSGSYSLTGFDVTLRYSTADGWVVQPNESTTWTEQTNTTSIWTQQLNESSTWTVH